MYHFNKLFQGQGKRDRFLYVRCDFGLDQRTGPAIQSKFSKHLSKEDAQQQLDDLKSGDDNRDQDDKKTSFTPWLIGGAVAVVGFLSLRG